MKKIIKYFFITLGLLLISLVLAIVVFVSMAGSDSQTKKDFSPEVMSQLAYIYKTKGYYPKSLEEIPLSSDKTFRAYVKESSFHYSIHNNNVSKYTISWRGGAMGWTGYRCTNDTSDIPPEHDGVVRTYDMPNGVVCTVTNLH